MRMCHTIDRVRAVALRKESVDRNIPSNGTLRNTHVALRKESVDRNKLQRSIDTISQVALRKESVDRNHVVLVVTGGCWLSLSARRAWIEMLISMLNSPHSQSRSPQGERG